MVCGTSMQRLFMYFILVLCLATGTVTASVAQDQQSSDIILTVSNVQGNSIEDQPFVFNLALLDALPQHQFSTTTIWTNGTSEFSGVLLRDIVEITGYSGDTITTWAINDYMAEFSIGTLSYNTALIATRHNGAVMHPRDKGPLWIVFPYSQGPDFQNEAIYAQSVWQLNRINVE